METKVRGRARRPSRRPKRAWALRGLLDGGWVFVAVLWLRRDGAEWLPVILLVTGSVSLGMWLSEALRPGDESSPTERTERTAASSEA